MSILLTADDVRRAITRIAHEIVERERDFSQLAIVGVRARGDMLATRLRDALRAICGREVPLGLLDITLYRDDLTRIGYSPTVHRTDIPFPVDDRVVILVDDVLFTGRSVRAALNLLNDFGRPGVVRLAVLVDRGGRELPIQPDFVGLTLTDVPGDHEVNVRLRETDGVDEIVVGKKG